MMPTEHDRNVEALAVALLILVGFTVVLIVVLVSHPSSVWAALRRASSVNGKPRAPAVVCALGVNGVGL
jgi:hypothetical protein